MAEVWKDDEFFAKLPGVQAGGIRPATERIGASAEANLARHRDEGDAEIETSYRFPDGFVTLSDEAGDRAAAAIEFGGTRPDGAPFPGLYILRRAAR